MPNPPLPLPATTIQAAWGQDVTTRVVNVYQNAPARDAALTTPEDGQLAWLLDEDILTVRIAGVLWVTAGVGTFVQVAGDTMEGRLSFSAAASGSGLRLNDDSGGTATFSRLYETARIRLGGTITRFAVQTAGDKNVLRSEASLFFIGDSVDNVRFEGAKSFPTTGASGNLYVSIGTDVGRLYVSTSASRFKDNVRPDDSIADLALQPVRYRHQGDGLDYIGFIADDMPDTDMIEYDADGEVHDYDLRAVVAVLAAKVNRLEAEIGAALL